MIEYEFKDINLVLRDLIAKINFILYDFIAKLSEFFPGLKR